MKKSFKILSLFLVLVTLLGSTIILTGCFGSKLVYELNKDGTGYVVMGFKEGKSAEELVIPATHEKLPVLEISFNAFSSNKDLKKVTFSENLEKISTSAFKNCTNLEEIVFSNTIKEIDKTAFTKTAIKELVIPDSVKNIGESAFEECEKLESLTLGSGMERIRSFAFSLCTKLSSLDLGTGLKCIQQSAFSCCSSLTEVTIPSSVEMIYGWAFEGCTKITKFTFENTEGWMNSEEYSYANLHMHPNKDLPSLSDPVENVKHFVTGTGGTYCAWRGSQPDKYPNPYMASIELLWYTCDTKNKWE